MFIPRTLKVCAAVGRRGYRLKKPFALPELTEPKSGAEQTRLIARVVRDNLVSAWIQLKAAAEFGGEDPLRPQFREHLDTALGRCERLRDELVVVRALESNS